jgi:hypothetical protein
MRSKFKSVSIISEETGLGSMCSSGTRVGLGGKKLGHNGTRRGGKGLTIAF